VVEYAEEALEQLETGMDALDRRTSKSYDEFEIERILVARAIGQLQHKIERNQA
jgi:hypothetical protein